MVVVNHHAFKLDVLFRFVYLSLVFLSAVLYTVYYCW